MKTWTLWLCIGLLGLATGCASDQATQKKLAEGKLAVEEKQFDTAIGKADAVLQSNASNVDSAAAHYIKGRSIEQRVKADAGHSESDLNFARTEYNRALQLGPGKKLEGYVRASLANIDYFQEDFAGAYEQWSKAYDLLQEQDLKAWTLYRIGLCQQRLGYWDRADKTFQAVIQTYPETEQAQRSRAYSGARGYAVQVATFKSLSSADTAVQELRQQGVTASKSLDPRGLVTVRIGPVNTYGEAKSLKARFAGKYPDALIVAR